MTNLSENKRSNNKSCKKEVSRNARRRSNSPDVIDKCSEMRYTCQKNRAMSKMSKSMCKTESNERNTECLCKEMYAPKERCPFCGKEKELCMKIKKILQKSLAIINDSSLTSENSCATKHNSKATKMNRPKNDEGHCERRNFSSPPRKIKKTSYDCETEKASAVSEAPCACCATAKKRHGTPSPPLCSSARPHTDDMCCKHATGFSTRVSEASMCPLPRQFIAPGSAPSITVKYCSAFDYVTFNQFQEIKQLTKLPRQGGMRRIFQFSILLLMTLLYFYFSFRLLFYLGNNLKMELNNADSLAAETSAPANRKFWDVIKPVGADLWTQSFNIL